MAIQLQKGVSLSKGQTVELRKNVQSTKVHDLSQITIGLGWDILEKKESFLKKLFSDKKKEEFDLDAIAFLLDCNGKVANLGKEKLFKSDVVFFGNMTYPSGSGSSSQLYPKSFTKTQVQAKVNAFLRNGELIVHTGDNLTGEGEGDDERIIIRLDSLPQKIEKILIVVSIYQGFKKDQHFGQVDNAFVRACDANNLEIAKFSLSNSPDFDQMRSMVFGEIYRTENDWSFKAIGNAEKTDNFVDILKRYT